MGRAMCHSVRSESSAAKVKTLEATRRRKFSTSIYTNPHRHKDVLRNLRKGFGALAEVGEWFPSTLKLLFGRYQAAKRALDARLRRTRAPVRPASMPRPSLPMILPLHTDRSSLVVRVHTWWRRREIANVCASLGAATAMPR